MKWYPWLRPAYEQLVANHQAGRGHHALLVHALPGMGDDSLIYALGRWLMCQQPDGQKSCGQCRACQLMQAQTHPDYYLIEPEKGKATLGIDAIREVTEKLYDRARLGGAKVVWIKDAAQLTEAAANALLKTLEEPPEKPGLCWAAARRSVYPPRCAAAVYTGTCRRRKIAGRKPGWRVKPMCPRISVSPPCG